MRRGLLGTLGALGMGAGAGVGRGGEGSLPMAAQVGAEVARQATQGVMLGSIRHPSADPLSREFMRRMDAMWRDRRRLQEILDLTGGVPPGVVACKSWAPWFKAAAVRRWRDEHMPDPLLVESMIRAAVFGPEPGGD